MLSSPVSKDDLAVTTLTTFRSQVSYQLPARSSHAPSIHIYTGLHVLFSYLRGWLASSQVQVLSATNLSQWPKSMTLRPLGTLWILFLQSLPHPPLSPLFPSPQVSKNVNWLWGHFPLEPSSNLSFLWEFKILKGVGWTPNLAFLSHTGSGFGTHHSLTALTKVTENDLITQMQLTLLSLYLQGSVCCT